MSHAGPASQEENQAAADRTRWPDAYSEGIAPDQRFLAERSQLFFRSSFEGTLTSALVGMLYCFVLGDHFDMAVVLRWLMLLLGICALRIALYIAFLRAQPAPAAVPRWMHASTLLATLNGLLWGLGGVWFHPGDQPYYIYYVHAFVIAGVPAGAISSLAAYWPAYAGYAGSGMLVFAGYLLGLGTPATTVVGLGALIYLTLLLLVARNYEKTLIESMRHRVAVEQLADKLQLSVKTAEAANDAKTQFLANMSHEIRTPMNAVLGLSELLVDSGLMPVQHERAVQIRRSAQALLGVINDVLDVSRIEAGRFVLAQAPFEPQELFTRARATLLPLAEAKGLALDIEVDANVPATVLGDAGRLRQILVNLAGNAIKFTERGRISIDVRAMVPADGASPTAAAAETVRLKIRVTDTGIGIPAEKLVTLFNRFVQVDASDTRSQGGTGLGLYIVRELAQRMGGSVSVSSAPGQGSRFEVEVELALPSPEAQALAARAARRRLSTTSPQALLAPRPGAHSLMVLLVEDNEINRVVARAMLEDAGHRVIEVTDGAQAVDIYGAWAFDCILMDSQMPVMDGIEATRRIRAIEADQGGRRTPIVALTANAMQGDRERYLAAGMDEFLGKPYERAGLLDALAQATRAAAETAPVTRMVHPETISINPSARKAAAGAGGAAAAAANAPEAAAQAAHSCFDPTALQGLVRLDQTSPGLMANLVRVFLADTPALIAQVAGEVPGDAQQVERAAHSIKSTCARFGAVRVSALAEQAEVAACSGDLDQTQRLGGQIRKEFARFEIAFKQHPAIAAVSASIP